MTERQSEDRSETVHRAMDHVLEAENEARASLEACRQEAGRILAEARRRARKLTDRTHRRIAAVRRSCATRTREEITAIRRHAEEERGDTRRVARDSELITAATHTVAERLTTNDERQ